MKNKIIILLPILILTSMLISMPVYADVLEDNTDNLKKLGETAEIGAVNELRDSIANFINVALTLVGIIFTGLIIYGGVIYMTAAGNQENIDKGKKIITWAVIGFTIIMLSLIISRFIAGAIFSSSGSGIDLNQL